MDRENRRFLKKLSICMAVLFVVVTAVSLFVMNFTPLNRLIGGYKEQKLDLSRAQGSNFVYSDFDDAVTVGMGYSELEFSDIDARVGSIGFDIELDDNVEKSTVRVDFSDSTTSYYRQGLAKLEMDGDSDNIMTCSFSGDVSRLRFNISVDGDGYVAIKNITLNQTASARHIVGTVLTYLLIATVAGLIIYLIANPAGARKKFSDNKLSYTRWAAAITAVTMALAVFFTFTSVAKGWSTTYFSFTSHEGNQISKELVDAFEHHQVHLLEEPNDELLALENPYDSPKRNTEVTQENFLWDHCLYNGKYYSYYGIGPVLALFLPYHLITGYYFPCGWATLLFALVGIIFLTKIYLAVIEKKFRELPTNTVLAGLITLQMSSGIMFSTARPLFYELAIAAGFMNVAIGAYLLISSNILWYGNISYVRLGFASFFLGYAVLCRPTLAV